MTTQLPRVGAAALAVCAWSAPGWGVLVVLALETGFPGLLRSLGVGRLVFVCALFSPLTTCMATLAWFRWRGEMSTPQAVLAGLAVSAGAGGGLFAWSRLGLFTPPW
jgi:hypothetical protein